MNNPNTSTETEAVIKKKKKIPKSKNLGPDCFTGELFQIFRKELMPILQKLFKKKSQRKDTSKQIL